MWTSLVMTRGDSRTFTITLAEEDGSPLDLTGVDIWMSVADLFSKRLGDGITVAVPANGIALVQVDPEDTSGLTGGASRSYDVQVKLVDGAIRTPISGRFIVTPDITTATS